MTSPFELFPKHQHGFRWLTRLNAQAPICPGKDTEDTACTCPDVMYAIKVRIRTAETIESRVYCGCCELPLHA